MAAPTLFFHQCPRCLQTMVAIARAVPGKPWHCVGCYSWMRFLYSQPVVSRREQQWAAYGFVYNPGISTCDVCGIKLTGETRIDLAGVGIFCSADCADPEVAKHEAAMAPRGVQS